MPNDEVFAFQCPQCGKRLRAGAALVGRRVKCPKCQHAVEVPKPLDPSAGPATMAAAAKTAQPSSPHPSSPQSSSPTTATTPTSLASVPVSSADDDWLNLGGPAIADLSVRQQNVEDNKAAKERERIAKKMKHEARRAASLQVTAESLKAASQPRLKKPQTAAAALASDNSIDDDLPELAPLTSVDAPAKHSKPSVADSDENVKRSVFDDDLPELAELQTNGPTAARPSGARPGREAKSKADQLLAKHTGVDLSDLGDLDALVPSLGATPVRATGASSGRTGKSTAPVGLPPLLEVGAGHAEEVEDKDPEYRITCSSCGTAQYVRLSNKGMKIKCPDCFLQFKIPGPPPGWSGKKKAKLQLTDEDMPLSAAEELHHAQTLQSQRSRASAMLEKAQREVSDEDLERLYDGDFDTAGFVKRTFGFLKDPIAIAHIIGYAIVFAMLFALGQFAANNLESDIAKGVLLLVAIGGPLLGLLFAMPMFSGGIALLESVANRQPRVADWPGFNLFDNAAEIAVVMAAVLGSMVPGFLVGSWLGGEGPGSGRIQIAGMMVTTFAMFPVILLSMLDNGSVFAPLSSSIFRSFSQAAEAWAGYYLKTLIAFSSVTLAWFLLLGKHEALAAAAGCLLPLLVFFTCQQIGALADAIGEHLSFEFVPSDKEDEKGDDDELVQKKPGGRNKQAMQS